MSVDVSVYDHVRATGETDYSPGIYRVVGVEDGVTLLRLTDEDGRRRATGEVVTVDGDAFDTGFAEAPNPDAGIAALRRVRNLLDGLWWELKRFVR